jgi:hypothetical protein
MTFQISPRRLSELAKIEEEAGCDIEAGLPLFGSEAKDIKSSIANPPQAAPETPESWQPTIQLSAPQIVHPEL